MRKLVWSALALAGLMQSTGCIIGDDDDSGAFHASWTITIGGNAASCDQAGVAEVEILTTDSFGQGIADQFPCDNFQGTTGDLAPDIYAVQVSALDEFEDAILSSEVTDESIFAGEVTELGTYEFAFTGGGPSQVSFSIDFGNAGGENCTETAVGGSGVIQQQLNVYDVGGAQCIVLDIAGSDDPAAETCSPYICTELDAIQDVLLDDGVYEFEVLGLKGATGGDTVVCYQDIFEVTVTGDGDAGTLVAPFAPDPADEAECNATKPARGR